MWGYTGQERPPFAEKPRRGQESVWDYPRPPKLVPDRRTIEVFADGKLLARTQTAIRVLETASPPTIYIPDRNIDLTQLVETSGRSFCEWKGTARYRALRSNPVWPVAWYYPQPNDGFAPVRGFTAFYPARVECFVNGERARPQPGGFYGGWITDEIVGPWKGEPGTGHW